MTKWRYVGWFSSDPLDTTIIPYPMVGVVEAGDGNKASMLADDELSKQAPDKHRLNWYVKRLYKAAG